MILLAVLGSRLVPDTLCVSRETDSGVALEFSPFIVDMDSIIDVYVQYVGSSRFYLFHLE